VNRRWWVAERGSRDEESCLLQFQIPLPGINCALVDRERLINQGTRLTLGRVVELFQPPAAFLEIPDHSLQPPDSRLDFPHKLVRVRHFKLVSLSLRAFQRSTALARNPFALSLEGQGPDAIVARLVRRRQVPNLTSLRVGELYARAKV
jgi:hypothetical protein